MQRIDALAHEVGVRIYGKDTIRISSGSAVYPRDAGEVDALLEQARRRMEEMTKTRSLQLCRTA
jgi:hypothetical protein